MAAPPYVTASEIVNRVNENLSKLGDESGSARFELQRRMPDGTTRQATDREVQAADMENKLQQAAGVVASLPNAQARIDWANAQRQLGNDLYAKKDYAEAIDIYLTCLLVAQQDDQRILFYQVMNNLALSALQLSWYRKACDFCRLALGQYELKVETASDEERVLVGKLYFRQGKARRLRGMYPESSGSLESALQWCSAVSEDDENRTASLDAIHKERRLLTTAENEAAKSAKKQKAAMKKILRTPSERAEEEVLQSDGLYAEKAATRSYSALRASTQPFAEDRSPKRVTLWQKCVDYYLGMAGRVATKLLSLIDAQSDKTD